jgi:hypothetical protein
MKNRLLIAFAFVVSSVILFSSPTTCNSLKARAVGKTGLVQADGVPLPPPPTKPKPTGVVVADGVPLPPPPKPNRPQFS